jgi:hypothetical protein
MVQEPYPGCCRNTQFNKKLAALLSKIEKQPSLERVKQLYEFSKTLPLQEHKERVYGMIIIVIQ